jgi:GntR family galactonate operon transcriptional repressor
MSKVTKTMDALVSMIIKSGAGATLRDQATLSLKFGVSRTVLREAISTLEYLNVLKVAPRRGTTINPPHEWKTRNDDVIEWQAGLIGKEAKRGA